MTKRMGMPGRKASMSPADILGEARRNLQVGVGGGPWRVFVITVLAAAAMLLPQLALLDANARATAFQQSGAATLIVQAQGRIDGRRCESFLDLPNVTAAGAVREQKEGVRLTLLPSTTVRYFESTPQFAAVLNASEAGTGLLLSQAVVDAVGWTAGDSLRIAGQGRVPTAGSFPYPDDGRVAGLGFSLISEVPAWQKSFDECWITVWPQSSEIESLASIVVAPDSASGDGSAAGPTLLHANSSLGTRFSVGIADMVWAYAPVAAMVFTAIATFFFTRARRLEVASARHVGVRASDQLAILVSEMLVCTLMAVVIVAPVALYLVVTATPDLAGSLGWHSLRGASAIFAGAIAGTVAGFLGIRERQLFRYFRER